MTSGPHRALLHVLAAHVLAALVLAGCATARPRATPAPRPAAPAAHGPAPSADGAPAPLATGRLPPLARPVRYALDLRVDPREERYGGTVRIEVQVPAPTRHVVLHARAATIEHAHAFVGAEHVAARATTRLAAGGREHPEELVLSFARPLPAGAARIELRYSSAFDAGLRGLFRARVGDDWYAYTDFEPADARRAFPCFDEPGFKVPVDVTLTVPDGAVAVANMNEVARTTDAAARTATYRFATTPPVPTYLVSFAVGPFEFYTGPTAPVPIRVVTTRGKSGMGRLAAEAAAGQLEILREYFDRAYPYPKLDLVAVPDFGPGAMENPGLITFREAMLLLDPERATPSARAAMAGIMAHELAHQWFGDLVTMAWWDDLWLNEGFATWMAYKVIARWQPSLEPWVGAVADRTQAMGIDGMRSARAIRQRVETTGQAMEAFDGITYDKGAAVLAMLEAWIGEDAFRAGVREYIRAHAWGNATAADLIGHLSRAAGRDIAPVASSFLDQPGVPLVAVETECPPGAPPRVVLSQSRFSSHGPPSREQRWQIPVCLRHDAAGTPRTQCTLLTEERATVPLEGGRCPRWVSPNAGPRGYYWYQLPPAGFRALLAAPGVLDEAGRINLVANARALTDAGLLPADAYLDILASVPVGRDAHLAGALVGAFWSLERTLVTADNRPAFQAFVARTLSPLARELGWAPGANEDDERRSLRRTVLNALGFLTDDAWVHAEADRVARRYLADPRSVPLELATVALPIASRHAGAERFDALVAALDRAATPQERVLVISALASFDDLALARRALDLLLTDTLRVSDGRHLLGRAGGHTAAHREMLARWARERFEALAARMDGHVRGLVWTVGGLCTQATRDEAAAFFAERSARYEGTERSLRQALEAADLCIARRARDGERASAWLRAHARDRARVTASLPGRARP